MICYVIKPSGKLFTFSFLSNVMFLNAPKNLQVQYLGAYVNIYLASYLAYNDLQQQLYKGVTYYHKTILVCVKDTLKVTHYITNYVF